LQRGTTYRIDSAFADSLQPALLHVYKWASNEWHKFLQLQPANPNLPAKTERTQKRGVSSSVNCRPLKRRRTVKPPESIECPPLQDRPTFPERKEHKVNNRPWATATEVAFYSTAPKFLWPGSVPIFGRPTPFERDSIIQERKMISAHICSEEAKVNSDFKSHHCLFIIDQAFVQWRNVGCQLCYASTGELEPDHNLEHCSQQIGSEKARKIFNWLQELKLPRLVHGIRACSLCFITNCPCGEVIAGIRLHEAECDDEKRHWQNLLNTSLYRDGKCQNKPVVKRTIAALCAYNNQVLGKYLSERLRDENSLDFMAQNLVVFWFEQFVNFHGDKVLRLLFVFDMLASAFDIRRSRSSAARNPCPQRRALDRVVGPGGSRLALNFNGAGLGRGGREIQE
jgi:hypothetical protein